MIHMIIISNNNMIINNKLKSFIKVLLRF